MRSPARSRLFSDGYAQPSGRRSIIQLKSWQNANQAIFHDLLDDYDWSLIDAAVIDEPYWTRLQPDTSDPCSDPSRRAIVEEVRGLIETTANALNAIAPKTRLWVASVIRQWC